jgi:fatty acid/phospholipid biosynthesis enzyme
VRIALDAMGSDRHPAVEVEGVVAALKEVGDEVEIVLVGGRERVEAEVGNHRLPEGRV